MTSHTRLTISRIFCRPSGHNH